MIDGLALHQDLMSPTALTLSSELADGRALGGLTFTERLSRSRRHRHVQSFNGGADRRRTAQERTDYEA